MQSNGYPSFTEIRDQILADIDAELQADGQTHGPIEYMWAMAVAGVVVMLHWSIRMIGKDRVPSTASSEYMRQWAVFFGITPKTATKNHGQAVFVANDPGAAIPAGHKLRLPSGDEFTTDAMASAVFDPGQFVYTITVDITAVEAGAAGAAAPGDAIYLGSPVPNVVSQGIVGGSGIGGGENDESDPSVLARLLEYLRDPPGGGTDADYRRWTRSTQGVPVLRVWIRPNTLGPASVKVLFTVDRANYIPSPIDADAVTAHLQKFKPSDVLRVEAHAPEVDILSPTIRLKPNTTAARNAAMSAIQSYLRSLDAGHAVVISHLSAQLSAVPEIEDHQIVSPSANVPASSADHVFMLDNPTWQTMT